MGGRALVSVAAARGFLERHGLAPSKELGQNFLCDDAQADKLVRLAEVSEGDGVLEIGTGLGILTRALARQARAVTSIEIDAGLVRALSAESALPANVRLVHADALAVDLAAEIARSARTARPCASSRTCRTRSARR